MHLFAVKIHVMRLTVFYAVGSYRTGRCVKDQRTAPVSDQDHIYVNVTAAPEPQKSHSSAGDSPVTVPECLRKNTSGAPNYI
jgi:hypothetical protein